MIFRSKLSNHALKRMSWVHSIRIQGVQETSIQLKYLPRNIIETSSGWKNVEWKLNWHDHPISPVFNDNALIVICWKRFIEVWRISTNGICELTAFSVPKLIQKRSRKTTVTHKQSKRSPGTLLQYARRTRTVWNGSWMDISEKLQKMHYSLIANLDLEQWASRHWIQDVTRNSLQNSQYNSSIDFIKYTSNM